MNASDFALGGAAGRQRLIIGKRMDEVFDRKDENTRNDNGQDQR